MGCRSASGEADAGALYPTLVQDTNGNRIIIRYMSGAGAQQLNTSSRILEIRDSRAVAVAVDRESGRKSYIFEYDDGIVPHLVSITSLVGRNENYHFTYEAQSVSSPFGGQGNNDNGYVHVLKTVQQEGHPPQSFEYNQYGELIQAQLPYGARFRWEYETSNNQVKTRVVSRRGLVLSGGAEEGVWRFSYTQNTGRDARRVTTLREHGGMAERVWSFNADLESENCGLLSVCEEKDANRMLSLTTYLWKHTAAGVPYIGTIETSLDPGAAEEAVSKEEFDRDIFGNLTENRKYDYGNPFQPLRVIRNTYLTDAAYIKRGIYDRLVTSSIGDGKVFTEQISNRYDTTPLAGVQDLTERDSGYGARNTIRGNLTESVVGGVHSRITYDIAGVAESIEDGAGGRITFTEDKHGGAFQAVKLIPDSNMLLGSQAMLHLNFKPESMMPTGVNAAFNAALLRAPEVGRQSGEIHSANTALIESPDGVYKLSEFDDFQRLTRIERGGKEGIASIIRYEWGHAAGFPLGDPPRFYPFYFIPDYIDVLKIIFSPRGILDVS